MAKAKQKYYLPILALIIAEILWGINTPVIKLGLPVYFLAWTTTPWTLPANTALAVNPDMQYVEVRVVDEIFILAKELAGKVLVDEQNHITGIVDWVTFGLTHPGLTLYQLAARPHIWEPFQKQYTNLGGTIQDDILYAAALIHVAWSITVWAPLVAGTEHELDVDETLQRFHSIYRTAVEVCSFR